MNNFDNVFTSNSKEVKDESLSDKKTFDKSAWAEQKQHDRENAYKLIDETAAKLSQDGLMLQKYLDVQGCFNRYSVSNALLILNQKPEATVLKDFEAWKEQGAYIRKKESGFYILEPGEEYSREDGTTGVSYKPKKVFDISQTGGGRRQAAGIDHLPVASVPSFIARFQASFEAR
jgi:ribosomal protein S25